MANPSTRKTSTLEFLATAILLFFLVNYGLKYLFPAQFGDALKGPPTVVLTAQSSKIKEGHHPVLRIENQTDRELSLPSRCPQPPVDIAIVESASEGTETVTDLMADETVLPCEMPASVPPKTTVTLDLGPWKYSLFSERGTYEASLEIPAGFLVDGSEVTRVSTRFTIREPGLPTKLFRTFVTKPLFNLLIFIASFVPDHNLGVAIIILTLIVKLILLIPNQHALEGQRKLQLLQPRIDELKRKYPDDSKRVQEETMKLWKELKINPLQSCLPTLLQFPILIGLFYVIRDGSVIQLSRHLLYPIYSDATFRFGQIFLGLDLLLPSRVIFPPLLVILQFIQMKMMFAKKKGQDAKPAGQARSPFDQQTLMLYVLPIIIGVFAFQFPAAVSLYWGVSTLFGIGQQWYVLRKKSA